MLLTVLSAADHIFQNSKNTVDVQGSTKQYLSVKDHSVEQEILLEGKLKQLRVYCVAPSGDAYDNAIVEFELVQGNSVSRNTIYAKEIEEGLYDISALVENVDVDEATIRIKGYDFPDGTDLFLLLSDDFSSGLNGAFYDEQDMEVPVVLNYTVMRYDKYFYYDLCMLILMIAVVIMVSFLLAYKPSVVKKGQNLFWCSFVLIFVYVSLKNPLASFLAEPQSEMAYEFWYKAHTMNFFDNMMSLMSGESLAWTERILMYIADLISPSKYVFIVAQLLEMVLICTVTSLFCMSYFRKYFIDEVRIFVSFFIGALMLFPSTYHFWAVSYWASFFFILVCCLDMDKLKKVTYYAILFATVILSVSRIYHIVYIPIAVFLYFYVGKSRGRRFKMYCITLGCASLFEVIYSMCCGGQGHLSGAFNLVRVISNTIYYQVQVLISYFCGATVKNPILANAFGIVIFLSILLIAIYLIVKKEKHYASALISLGILSVGTIAINVTVCGMSDSVGFPHDYFEKVSWATCYFQQADLHFSYAYIAITGIFLVLLFYLKEKLIKNGVCKMEQIVMVVIVGFIFNYGIVNGYTTYLMRIVPTDWKSISYIVNDESYYASINVDYPFADISLAHNSRGYIYGMNDSGQMIFWNVNRQPYDRNSIYHEATIGNDGGIAEEEVLTITAKRANMNFANPYTIVVYDEAGNELARTEQKTDATRCWMDFIFDEPVRGVYSIAVYDEQGNDAWICDALQIGVADN